MVATTSRWQRWANTSESQYLVTCHGHPKTKDPNNSLTSFRHNLSSCHKKSWHSATGLRGWLCQPWNMRLHPWTGTHSQTSIILKQFHAKQHSSSLATTGLQAAPAIIMLFNLQHERLQHHVKLAMVFKLPTACGHSNGHYFGAHSPQQEAMAMKTLMLSGTGYHTAKQTDIY